MPIVIMLLSSIVALLFGGPLLGVVVLLIGLIILFPNIFGVIAAIIGVSIVLGILENKFNIDTHLLYIIILFTLLLFGLLGALLDMSDKNKDKKKKKKIDQAQQKVKESIKILTDAKITCNIINTMEKETTEYSINPNTDNVWAALCDFLIYRRAASSNIIHDLKSLNIKYPLTNEEININRDEKEIFLTLKNVKEPPYFVPHIKESQVLEKKNILG